MNNKISICIVGSGTAGLLSALMMRFAFPNEEIKIVSSSKIGIVGVGEGSTEHWKDFMRMCNIPLNEMLIETAATHKYGIRFENWSEKTPDYFHSVSGDEEIYAFGYFPTYMGFIQKNKLLTNMTTTVGLTQGKIRRVGLHENTNQYHFDTFKMNQYFSNLCFQRNIIMTDGDVSNVNINPEDGHIDSVDLEDGRSISADFWIDASGFSRVLISALGNAKWNSFSKYLLCDSAIAFPTESNPSGIINVYTRARAVSGGWMWEIPTQERRGNGYVFSSSFTSHDQAVEEAQKVSGYSVPDKHRVFKFDPGHLENCWVKNCCAVGLASSFVEPLEATSIGGTIQQIKWLIPDIASYKRGNTEMQKKFNKSFNLMMDNILFMIRMHYISDRRDTEFWRACADMPINDSLEEAIGLWQERMPRRNDFSFVNGEMFGAAHFIHVAQGQNCLNPESVEMTLQRLGIQSHVSQDMSRHMSARHNHELVDHAEALREIQIYG